MGRDRRQGLIDLIYEAAVEPDLWPTVMERVADAVSGTGAWLSDLDMVDGGGGGLITRIDPQMPSLYAAYYAQRNPLSNVADPDEYLSNWAPRILTDEDWMPKAELLASEYYNDFLRPQDIHSTVMIRLAKRGRRVAVLNINRTHRQEQYGPAELEILADLHPHLIRGFDLTQRFSGLRDLNRGLAEMLDRSPQAMLLTDAAGRIRHSNRAAEALLTGEGGGIVSRRGVLTTRCVQYARKLAALIACAAGRNEPIGGSMAIDDPSIGPQVYVSVAPASAARGCDSRSEGGAIVCVTARRSSFGNRRRQLRDLFGLTEAEARVALSLLTGASPAETATAHAVSLNTVRTQISRILEKTDTRRQADLIRLLARTVSLNLD